MNNILFTIPFSELYLWDVKRFNKTKVKSQYPIDFLGNHINEENTKVILNQEPDKEFNILGITNNKGMMDAYTALGKEFNQSYKIVEEGFIAYNPYRINVGSIGIKTSKTIGKYISPAYVVFSCKNTILPEYLYLLMKSKTFNELVKESTSGSVRQNLTFKSLSKIKIPIPSLEKQKEIVNDYYTQLNKIEKNNTETKKDEIIIKALGAYDFELNKKQTLFSTIRFNNLRRWDQSKTIFNVKSSKYKIVPFRYVCLNNPLYGANCKGVDEKKEYRYIRITDINEDGTLNNEIKYPDIIDLKYELKNNDFLIARSGNTVGKTFLYTSDYGKCLYAGYLVKYQLNNKIINPLYLLYYTKSIIFKNWISLNQRIAGQPNINGKEYLDFPLILPPLEIQNKIVENLKQIYENEINIKYKSNNDRKAIQTKFENTIFIKE